MTAKTSALIGFFGGAIIGGGISVLGIAPSTVAILMKPLTWLTDVLHPFPSESPANIVVALPMLFVYWGCLGMVLTLSVRSLVIALSKKRRE